MKFCVDEEVCAVPIKMTVRGGEVEKECEVHEVDKWRDLYCDSSGSW